MGAKRPRPVVFDTGALIAFERNEPRVRRLIELAVEHGVPVHVPAGVVAQAWRDGSKQTRLSRLVGSGWLSVQPLDTGEAKGAGIICGRRKTSDVIDASVVLLARRYSAVVTSDSDDIARLDADLQVVSC
jgi:predicted nucleic acid-binding protein